MPCPHSSSPSATPEACSQCRGATPKLITREESTGQLYEDGIPAERPFQPATYGRNGPPRRKGGRPRKDAVPAIVEPEPVDDLE